MRDLPRASERLRNPGVDYIFKEPDCYPTFQSLANGKDFFTFVDWVKINALTTPFFEQSSATDFVGMVQEPPSADRPDTRAARSIFSKISKKEYDDYINRRPSAIESGDVEVKFSESERKQIKKHQAQKIFEDEDTLVVCPLSYESSIIYGYGTKWCTSSNSTREYYDTYSADSEIVIIINNKIPAPYQKIALILFSNNKFCLFDSLGCIINDGRVFDERGKLWRNDGLSMIDHVFSDQLGLELDRHLFQTHSPYAYDNSLHN